MPEVRLTANDLIRALDALDRIERELPVVGVEFVEVRQDKSGRYIVLNQRPR